ncbi:TetR/AcrR family transcriptional regulator [Paenibacillus sanfengchensis]|uniref:TetR/AcrR family transcriptional regulator n=1 Tax=Paenibacillus sanfengchensis TaxID=3119819 RepID=UPI002FE1D746
MGRPRSEAAKNAVFQATLELIEQAGSPGLTIDAVAAHAGVSKATIYRWWRDKTMLVLEVFLSLLSPWVDFDETLPVRDNFIRQLKGMAALFDQPLGRSVLFMIAGSEADSQVVEGFHSSYLKPKRNEAKTFLEAGIRSGELLPDIDLDITLDLIYAPVYHRFLVHKNTPDSTYIEKLVDCVLNPFTCDSKKRQQGL